MMAHNGLLPRSALPTTNQSNWFKFDGLRTRCRVGIGDAGTLAGKFVRRRDQGATVGRV